MLGGSSKGIKVNVPNRFAQLLYSFGFVGLSPSLYFSIGPVSLATLYIFHFVTYHINISKTSILRVSLCMLYVCMYVVHTTSFIHIYAYGNGI